MSKIAFLKVSNFIGVDEQELKASKINIFKGPKGKGKSSLLEAIEKTFTNKSRRTEVIKHGTDEATLYVELDNGLEIDRRLRSDKADYLKIRKEDSAVPSTEKFLRNLVNGDIFRPIDWVNMSVKEQTKSLLGMLEISWNEEDIVNWFGDLVDDIDYTQHILIILKNIEQKYYKTREEVNREVKELKARICALYEELPAEYDGEEWKSKNIQEYYKKVSEAQEINKFIEQAKLLRENFDNKVATIKANAESEKARVELRYKTEKEDIKDIIDLSKSKIGKAEEFINNSNVKLEIEFSKLDNDYEAEHQALLQKYSVKKDSKKREIAQEIEAQKDLISIHNNKISVKEQELLGLDEKMDHEFSNIDEKGINAIEKENIRIGKAAEYLNQHNEIDVTPLQEEADLVTKMVSYLRDWDRISEIRDGVLSQKEEYSKLLTSKVDKARLLPQDLLKTAKMPVDGISVDVNGNVRIDGKLIDGLSDGEKLELAMKVAKAQCGELKVICLDKFESLDTNSQEILKKEMLEDEYQYFVTQVADTDNEALEIERLGE